MEKKTNKGKLEIFTETLEQNIRKSHKRMFFRWKRRQINKN